MPRPRLFVFASLIALAQVAPAPAQTMFRWVDRNGGVHYSDDPPATEAHNVEHKAPGDFSGNNVPYAVRSAADRSPVTLYSTPSCVALCNSAREMLQQRHIPFSERVVRTKDDANALSQALGGQDAVVPSLAVGHNTAKGFQAAQWNALLDAAGYPKSRR